MDRGFSRAAEQLAATVLAPQGTYEEASVAARAVLEIARESVEDLPLDAGVELLVPAIREGAFDRAGIAAIVCGTLVEYGARPDIALDALVERLGQIFERALQFVDACREHFETHIVGPDALDCECGELHDREEIDFLMPQVQDAVREAHPELEQAWVSVDLVCRPSVSMLTRVPHVRRELASNQGLVEIAARLSRYHPSAHLVWALLSMLEEEELVVLAPQQRKGFRVLIDGVSDNFQLQTLLADALLGAGHFEGEPPSSAAVAVARGEGPQYLQDEYVEGSWNLYNFTGLGSDRSLPDGYFDQGQAHRIFNEGVPADIAALDGRRIVLLGPAPFYQPWTCARMFDAVSAKLEIVEIMDGDEVDRWLDRILARDS